MRLSESYGMTEKIEVYTAALGGFLNALQRIADDERMFSVGYADLTGGIDDSLFEYISNWGKEFRYLGRTDMNSDDVMAFFQEGVYSKLDLPKKIIHALEFQLLDYYGLISTGVDDNGPFQPLLSEPLYRIEVERNNSPYGAHFLVQIGKYGVVTSISARSHNQCAQYAPSGQGRAKQRRAPGA